MAGMGLGGKIFQMARYPFAQPTAISVGESQVKQVQSVSGGRVSKAAVLYLTIVQLAVNTGAFNKHTVSRARASLGVQIDIEDSDISVTPHSS